MIVDVGEVTVHRTGNAGQIIAAWSDGIMIYELLCSNLQWEEMENIIKGISYEK